MLNRPSNISIKSSGQINVNGKPRRLGIMEREREMMRVKEIGKGGKERERGEGRLRDIQREGEREREGEERKINVNH